MLARLLLALRIGLCAGILTDLLVVPTGAAEPVAAESPQPFGLTRLWTIDLRLPAAHWDAMQPTSPRGRGAPPGVPPRLDRRAGPLGPPAVPAVPVSEGSGYPWSTCTFASEGTVLTNVAIRFKGNSSFGMSLGGLKRPFKLDFNRGAKGRHWQGATELLLNNNANDATQLREAVAYEAVRQAGLPAPRTAFARVYLTIEGKSPRQYLGLYTLVEPVDERFLKSRFGSKKGLLLKPERLPTVQYLGENWAPYAERYQPQTPPGPADQRRVIGLARLIAQADDLTFRRELPSQLDVTNLLRYVAINAWLANYDSFLGNGHNYYLFLPPEPARATFIPWDLNEAFGGHPPGGTRSQQLEASVLQPQANPNRLIERVLADPNWAAEYRRLLREIVAGPCRPERLQADVARVVEVIREAVVEESPAARARFERIALGRTDVTLPRLGTGRDPNPGMGPAGLEDIPLANWIERRDEFVRAELDGARTASRPRGGVLPGLRP